jgi:hypothetical protein
LAQKPGACVRLPIRGGLSAVEPFESAWLKWGQAVTNADVLRDSVVTLAGQPDLRVETQYATVYDAKRHCVRLVIAEIGDPFPVLWGLLLGDIVHNYRCCLDHIAWSLYERGRNPDLTEREEQVIGFPICAKRVTFNKTLNQKLPGVRRADRAIVRRYQPYKWGESRAYRHVFTVLRDLSNDDKHRTIQPVVPVPQRITFNNLRPTDCIVRRAAPAPGYSGTLQPGTELARFYVKKTGPQPHIDVEPHFALTPAINERLTLIEFLKNTMVSTAIVLRQFSDPPPSLLNLVGPLMPAQD